MLLKSEPCDSQMATRISRAYYYVICVVVIPASRDVMCLVRYRAMNPRFDVEMIYDFRCGRDTNCETCEVIWLEGYRNNRGYVCEM